jgi:hypothetical protein
VKSPLSATAVEAIELASLVPQLNEAIPKMRASLDRVIAAYDTIHRETDAFLCMMGVRK